MKSLLGIDIDGVFNIVSYDAVPNDINRTPVRYLNKILEAIPECDVLITSSWCNYDNKTIEALVSAGFKYPERVIGNTENLSGEYSRTKEIKKWLEDNNKSGYYKNKVYLDDEIVLFDYFEEGISQYQVVECRADRGLDLDKAYETICKLQGFDLKFWM